MDHSKKEEDSLIKKAIYTYSVIAVWMVTSGAVVLYNKYLLSFGGFPYPIALTMWHMFFCASLAIILVQGGKVQGINMDLETYKKAIIPIGACYAGTLWGSNSAYVYLSVPFIQMLKALMPVSVFSLGCVVGTEKFQWPAFFNMLLVTLGVIIASYGEINFNLTGVLAQLAAIVTESIRLVLVQILLQSKGLKLNPITTLYYVAPCCFVFLLIPFTFLELHKITSDATLIVNPFHMIANGATAFCLNMAVFLLIDNTSALTMNVAGVVKDWALIGLSVLLFHAVVSQLNLLGYFVAFLAVCWYNFRKVYAAQEAARLNSRPVVVASSDDKEAALEDDEKMPLTGGGAKD